MNINKIILRNINQTMTFINKRSLLIIMFFIIGLASNNVSAELGDHLKLQITENSEQVQTSMEEFNEFLLALSLPRNLNPEGIILTEVGLGLTTIKFEDKLFTDIFGQNTNHEYNNVLEVRINGAIGIPIIPLEFYLSYFAFGGVIAVVSTQASYDIIRGGVIAPKLTLAASYNTANVADTALDTTSSGVDLRLSKGFGVGIKIIPYVGAGSHSVTTEIKSEFIPAGSNIKQKYKSTLSRTFVGASLMVGIINYALQVESIGSYSATSIKVGLVF